MTGHDGSPRERIRPLLRVRQVREFTDEPIDAAVLEAITDVARWSGSSKNSQPWRFIVVRDGDTIRQMFEVGMPQTRSLKTAVAAIVTVLPVDPENELAHVYDDARAADRILTAASFLGLGGGIMRVRQDVLAPIRRLLHLPDDRTVRTIVSLGYPTEAARQPKAAPGEARLPREEMVFIEHWPDP